jgi:hypothetical protein
MTKVISWPRWRQLGILGLLAAALAAPARAQSDGREPELGDCEELAPPEGSKVALAAYAEGVQIYRWKDGTGWSFVAPEAVLYSAGEESDVIGIHYGGPTWESTSGSKVRGAIIDRCFPDPDAIPWLLLGAVSSDAPGIFHRVTHIQRLYTTGGLAPAEPGDFDGDEARIPYTAWYFFYR